MYQDINHSKSYWMFAMCPALCIPYGIVTHPWRKIKAPLLQSPRIFNCKPIFSVLSLYFNRSSGLPCFPYILLLPNQIPSLFSVKFLICSPSHLHSQYRQLSSLPPYLAIFLTASKEEKLPQAPTEQHHSHTDLERVGSHLLPSIFQLLTLLSSFPPTPLSLLLYCLFLHLFYFILIEFLSVS